MIMYLCMKYESNTPMYSKDIARKPFFVCTGQDVRDVRTRVMLYPPPPQIATNSEGIINKIFQCKIVNIFLPINLTYVLGAQKNSH